MLHDCAPMRCLRIAQFIGRKSKMVAARGWGEGEMGSYLMIQTFSVTR